MQLAVTRANISDQSTLTSTLHDLTNCTVYLLIYIIL